ncbi:hypothetical protein [Aquincola agrisoli]
MPHGDADVYVRRLSDMLGRHCPRPFQLYCYTDRPRSLPEGVIARDCSGWTELEREGMRPTTRKLGLFNPAYVEFDSFLYLDLSLVIQRSLAPLLDHAMDRPEDLVIVSDWNHAGYNSSVMRIRRGPLRAIYDAFVDGERFEQRVMGDQEFIHGVVTARGLQSRVALFPPGQIASFKSAVRLLGRDPVAAGEQLRAATIVKFHGQPKMHEAFGLRYRWLRVRLPELLRGHLAPVLPLAELRREWTGNS